MYRHIHVAQEKVNNHVLAEEIREKGSSEDKKNENYLQAVGIKYFF